MLQFQTSLEETIYNIIEPILSDIGYNVVRVKFDDNSGVLQIMLENLDGSDVNIDDCEKSSRAISTIMDVEDPIEGEYNLEVSSPGIDRPLTRLSDFKKYLGYEVQIRTHTPIEKRKKFKGLLVAASEEALTIKDENSDSLINFADIASAKLVLNDQLLKNNE